MWGGDEPEEEEDDEDDTPQIGFSDLKSSATVGPSDDEEETDGYSKLFGDKGKPRFRAPTPKSEG